MRFLIVTQYFPPEVGAPQIRLLALAQELGHRGHEVEVVTALPNYPRGRIFDGYRGRFMMRDAVGAIPVVRTWLYPATGRGMVRRTAGYLSFTVTALVGCLLARRPDYVVVESPPLFLGITAVLYGAIRRVPYIFNVSDLWPASAAQLGMVTNRAFLAGARWLERRLYRRARWLSGQTEGIRAGIRAVRGAGTPVLFLPNGVDTHLFQPAPPDRAWVGEDELAFTFAGTHGYAQGLDVILGAAELTRSEPAIVYLLVGEGPDKRRLQESAAARGLDNVRFAPAQPVTAMPAILSASRASIVPLLGLEIFRGARPSKIMTALACETPVILSGEGEAAALITESGAGLVVPPEDPQALACAVRCLAGDPQAAAAMGRRGRELAVAEFGWEGIVGKWLAGMGC